jgi:hypothetical protein
MSDKDHKACLLLTLGGKERKALKGKTLPILRTLRFKKEKTFTLIMKINNAGRLN